MTELLEMATPMFGGPEYLGAQRKHEQSEPRSHVGLQHMVCVREWCPEEDSNLHDVTR